MMTTTKLLLTVSTAWNSNSEKCNDAYKKNGLSSINTPEPDRFVAKAIQEIRETLIIKEQTLQQMRDWLSKNPDVKNVRLDDSFLLRFLRQKKYSVLLAQQTLLKYLNLRRFYPEMSMKLDCEDPSLKDIINKGYIVVSPIRDGQGRRVIVYDMKKFDAIQYGCWEMSRVHYLVYESLIEDEENQILGFTHVGDASGVSSSHITTWNPIDFARLMKWGEQSIPMRHKEFHIINVPTTIKYVVDFACSKVSAKMSSRLHIHENKKSLLRSVDINCLPSEYGGKITREEMVAYTKNMLLEHRAKVLELDNMEILSTQGITSSKNKSTPVPINANSIQGSFRKLEID